MIVEAKTAHAIAAGRVKTHVLADEPKFRAGKTVAVQPGVAREAVCRIVIDAVERHPEGWLLRFHVDPVAPLRYLARRSQYGYTPISAQAFERTAPAVDDETLAWITSEARDRKPVGQPRGKPPAEPGLIERVEHALRDELATRFRGTPPEDVAAESPRQGTPGDVRARRRAMGLRAADGLYPVPADQVDELVASMAEEGCSVRDVALALDCSVGKAHKLLAPYRNHEEEAA